MDEMGASRKLPADFALDNDMRREFGSTVCLRAFDAAVSRERGEGGEGERFMIVLRREESVFKDLSGAGDGSSFGVCNMLSLLVRFRTRGGLRLGALVGVSSASGLLWKRASSDWLRTRRSGGRVMRESRSAVGVPLGDPLPVRRSTERDFWSCRCGRRSALQEKMVPSSATVTRVLWLVPPAE